MTPEREKLIRETWAGVRGWPVADPVLHVAIRKQMTRFPERLGPEDIVKPIDLSETRLTFVRGFEHSDDGQWDRFYVECEGVRVVEDTRPAGSFK